MALEEDAVPEEDLAARLMVDHYETLKKLARSKRRRSGAGETIRTTDLLHESWFKIRRHGHWRDESHFMRTVALAMRNVLVDHARAKLANKRSGGAVHLPYLEVAENLPEWSESPSQILEIDDLLRKLGELKPRLSEIVTLRYFGGFTESEAAGLLGVTERTVRRDWQAARAWLAAEMGHGG